MIQSGQAESGEDTAKKIFDMTSSLCEQEHVVVMGPTVPGISKIKDIYRHVLYYKYEKYDTLIQIKNMIEASLEAEKNTEVLVSFDFDPLNT